MYRKASIAAVLLSCSGLYTASACEFHRAGQYGSRWSTPYTEYQPKAYGAEDMNDWATRQLEDAEKNTALAQVPPPQSRPSFSSAATSAATTAQTKLKMSKFQRMLGLHVIFQTTQRMASNTNR